MRIVHLGYASLQIEREATRYEFWEKLKQQLQVVVRGVVARCIEGALGRVCKPARIDV